MVAELKNMYDNEAQPKWPNLFLNHVFYSNKR
jgi:hypothetical protein